MRVHPRIPVHSLDLSYFYQRFRPKFQVSNVRKLRITIRFGVVRVFCPYALLDNRKIVVVHINDAVSGRGRDEQFDLERELPCATGVIDSAAFVRCIKKLKYDGPVIVEPFNKELNRLQPEEIAQRVIESARRMLALA